MNRLIATVVLALLATHAAAADNDNKNWQTNTPTVMYDAPSQKARPLLILTGGFPLKQVSKLDGWHKVTTHAGDTGWVTADTLRAGLGVVIINARAAIRVDPHPAAAAVFYAKHGVWLDVLDPTPRNGWIKVLHEDGEIGYLQLSDSWQNY